MSPLAGYAPAVRRLIFWYDGLTDRQRLQYIGIAILFLLACGGYLLGLGSTIMLQRVEAEEAFLAAQPLPTEEPTPTEVVVAPTAAPTNTLLPSPTPVPPTAAPTRTPFAAPEIAEPPAAPRVLPAEAPAAPVVPAARRPTATPTTKPRNLETSRPEPPAASVETPTPGLVRPAATSVPTAVRRATAAPTLKPAAIATVAVTPTTAPTRAAVVAATPTRAAPTPAKTPQSH